MSDNTRKRNSQVEIHDLIDDAVNNALVRRSEALLPLSDEEANSIAGGTTVRPILGVVLNPCPTTIGLVVDPKPTPCPPPKPQPIPCPSKPPIIINGIIIKPCFPLADS